MAYEGTINDHHYITKGVSVYAADSKEFLIVALESQDIVIYVDSQDSVVFIMSGILYEPDTGTAEKFMINAYPTAETNVLLYSVPANKQFIGKITARNTSIDYDAHVRIAVTMSACDWSSVSDLEEYHVVGFMNDAFGLYQYSTVKTRDLFMKAGDILALECSSPYLVARYFGILYDAEGGFALINGARVCSEYNKRQVYECPEGYTATITFELTNTSENEVTGDFRLYMQNINLTEDSDGLTADGGEGGGGGGYA